MVPGLVILIILISFAQIFWYHNSFAAIHHLLCHSIYRSDADTIGLTFSLAINWRTIAYFLLYPNSLIFICHIKLALFRREIIVFQHIDTLCTFGMFSLYFMNSRCPASVTNLQGIHCRTTSFPIDTIDLFFGSPSIGQYLMFLPRFIVKLVTLYTEYQSLKSICWFPPCLMLKFN